ncbi:MAG: hypothetical protein H7A46_18920 [Verrucomicrobiales bacterium]|nr:hypothetical protein [Verrucomicrobiales bacterium]
MKPPYRVFVVCGLVLLGLIFWQGFFGGSHVKDTAFTREFNQISLLACKVVNSKIPPPKGPDSTRIEAFESAGILSSNDVAYVRQHGIEFHGFDGTRTGANVAIFEAVCTSTKPPRRIIGHADGHAECRELRREP